MRAKKSESTFVLCPEGVHVGRLIRIVDLGTQLVDYKKGNGVEEVDQLDLIFETPEELHEFKEEKGPEPFLLRWTVTNKIGSDKKPTNLKKIFEALTGEVLDETVELATMISYLGQIDVKHSTGENQYANITQVLPLSKLQIAAAENGDYPEFNDQYLFDLENFDQEIFDSLTKKQKEDIAKSQQYAQALAGGSAVEQEQQQEEEQPEEQQVEEELFPEKPAPPPPARQPVRGVAKQPTPAPAKQNVAAAGKKLVPGKGFAQPAAKTAAKTVTTPVKTAAKVTAKTGVQKKGFR